MKKSYEGSRLVSTRSGSAAELSRLLAGAAKQKNMSDLIRCRRAVTTRHSSEPPASPTSAPTAPALMDHLAADPVGSQAPASSAALVAQPVSTRRYHQPASITDTTSTDASGSQPGIDFLQLQF
ncbi:hypothetical protein L3X38_042643 [Prunus dulcis]|uniref:Uncharacterized protein n=1 Tax=Prunus dulcis TaxID=3755 RepID=A0AAD4UWY8_PRUDU|nr:hypothetical protein L3X38_042643 [Prunus dulcis]